MLTSMARRTVSVLEALPKLLPMLVSTILFLAIFLVAFVSLRFLIIIDRTTATFWGMGLLTTQVYKVVT